MQQSENGPERATEILTSLVPPEQWSVYAPLFSEGVRRGIRFVVGGGLAVSAYSAAARYTKDMDLFVREEESGTLLEMLRDLGFEEYTEVPYDPTWSYRGHRNGVIVDVLWSMLNGKAAVEEQWLTEGWEVRVRGTVVRLIPIEELIVTKLYILNARRCDWPDILNLLYGLAARIRWTRLCELLGDDLPLLGGVMNVFRWLCPGRAALVPPHLWRSLGLLPPAPSDLQVDWPRVNLLSTQKWFIAAISGDVQ